MKTLIQHLWKENTQEIINKSYKNCHTIGLDSIMLLESPGKTIRLFIANENHLLWKNIEVNKAEPLSIAFHSHHCNIDLYCIEGEILNRTIKRGHIPIGILLGEYIYKSYIKEQRGTFEFWRNSTWTVDKTKWIKQGENLFLFADQIHTVGVEKGKTAAWFVFEGREDYEYNSTVYSNHNPNEDMSRDLYGHLTEKEIVDHLKRLDLL